MTVERHETGRDPLGRDEPSWDGFPPLSHASAPARPRLLDLFCGAGGAAMGYYRAGFDVVGVDIVPQPHYPFAFVQADAMTYPLEGFDAIHASPPCQAYSRIQRVWHRADDHPDLLAPTRARLEESGVPYVIENVGGSPIRASVMLCGTMFGLAIRKHRWFETSGFDVILAPASCGDHALAYNPWKNTLGKNGPKNNRTIVKFREAMGTPWIPMGGGASRARGITGDIFNAIPPAYTEWLGGLLIRALPHG